jgi:hypothetical protein
VIIDGAASGVAKRRNFSSVDVAQRKILCTFFYRIYPTENIVYADVLQIFHKKKTMRILRTLRLMHDGISFDKIYRNKWVILGQELTENNLKNREFGHNSRSATSQISSPIKRKIARLRTSRPNS